MSNIGIIAEYNPFHNGHLYHLNKAREAIEASGTICVMSGNFTQRGEPALFNKWARAEMALKAGIDLVLELPALYATKSAYWFARGGVETLVSTGLVSHLAFGVEDADPKALSEAAERLAQESPAFKKEIAVNLKGGMSYPRARALALNKEFQGSDSLLDKPNNILGISYLQVIKEKQLPLIPLYIKRQGANYHDIHLNSSPYPSASSIRHQLENDPKSISKIKEAFGLHLPESTLDIIEREINLGKGPVFLRDLDLVIMTLLRRTSKNDIKNIIDVTEGLENRIKDAVSASGNLQELLSALKTKRYTYTKLQRFLIHLLLNYNKDMEAYLMVGPPYLRVLGFTKKGKSLLFEMKKTATCPLIIKTSHIKKHLNNNMINAFWNTEVLASDIYALLFSSEHEKNGGQDYLKGPVRI